MNPSVSESSATTMLADVIAGAPSIATMMSELISPILTEREAIRDHLALSGYLITVPEHSTTRDLVCTDGALTSSPLAIGDHYATLAVSVLSRNGSIDTSAHESWSTFVPHSPAADTLATAVMLTHELVLATQAPDEALVVLDGSHATAVTAITDLFANTDTATVSRYLDVFDQRSVFDTVQRVLTNPRITAQQKHDSSTHLWSALQNASLPLTGTGLPDKPLASLLLDPGEALTHPACEPVWDRAGTHLAAATTGTLRGALREFLEPLVTERQIRVAHVKPRNAQLALRVEYKHDLPTHELTDDLAALSADVEAPHVQEPVVQYVADKLAKTVSSASTMQLESARIEAGLSGHADLVPYLLHYYRT